MNIALWLDRVAATRGADPALFLGDTLVADYATFHAHAAGLAHGLRDRGIRPGDRVALFMKNCPEYLIALYAIWISGAAVVPINAKLHPKEADFILKNAGAVLAITSPSLGLDGGVAMIDAGGVEFTALCALDPMPTLPRKAGDLAWLFYTSGTTGQPKGVFISHGMMVATSLSYLADVDEISPDDAAYYMAPMSHGAGMYAPVHVLCGARHICPVSGGFDEVELLDAAATMGPLSMFMAPTMVRRFTDVAQRLDRHGEGIKTIVYGGGPMYVADIVEAVDWFGPRFVQIYGQGECPMAITALSRGDVADRDHPRWAARLASVGRAQSVVEVAIGGAKAPGDVGEIMVRGLPVMPGYWRNLAATNETLVDGWLMTGDMGFLDEDGYLTMRDRSKDVIISGGTNIYPREVEEALLTHPGVREVSVVGKPDPEWGEVVVAFVASDDPGPSEADLDAYCLAQIARFKRPKAYIWVSELPKNNYGKVLKTELRKRLEEDAT